MEQLHENITDIDTFTRNESYRGDCYKLLAACFYQPAKEIFLEEGLFENLSGLLKQVCPDAAVFSDTMKRGILNYGAEDLLVEYAKLFVGPYELKAAPYGSVYLDGGGKTMGDSTMEVLKIYNNEGLAIADDFRELPDHIAVELEFMYYLISRETEALKESDTETAVRFFRVRDSFKHAFLGKWVAPFCEKIKEETENSFYRALSDCLSVFIAKELEGEAVPEVLTA